MAPHSGNSPHHYCRSTSISQTLLDTARQSQPPPQIPQVVGEQAQPQAYLIAAESMAAQPRHLHRQLAFLNPVVAHNASWPTSTSPSGSGAAAGSITTAAFRGSSALRFGCFALLGAFFTALLLPGRGIAMSISEAS